MNRLLLLLLFITGVSQSKAQDISVDILQQGSSFSDSSYYDIAKVEDKFWICGKYGILKSIDKNGKIENIEYPSENLDIYKLENLSDETLIASGDKGTVYFHDIKTKKWRTVKVKGYENACFYNLTVDYKKNIYLSGGNSKIAHSGKTVPNGFILVSSDMGKTWTRIYHNLFNMVWCVKVNPYDQKVYALMYSPNKTDMFVYENQKWNKKQKLGNSIFHEIQFESESQFVATGGWIGKKGRIYTSSHKKIIEGSGLLWGRVKNEKYTLYTGCNGNIILDQNNSNLILHHTSLNLPFSLYEAIFIDENSAYAIGSGRTLLKINIKENPVFEVKNQ
ncbi:hypothetical protein EGI22_14780 [Lacihabitans sp. LS3-19]|uniref:hypothetical protein n=1 Tax=Lacihabitans sp. LS3-19 TaxID=2487335 RepID=UPI0020CFBA36|nr:hypothetical protein [Lacihabitans sp. LS3-19]MCP9769181.1 hypothetical protein [Lacihabitans sp. LS3-19]